MKKLCADWIGLWLSVWRRDATYHDPLDRVFFDKTTGDLLWISGEEDLDQESTERLAEYEQEPERYEEIQPLTHGEHHDIFREFFDGLPPKVQDLCNRALIGGFLEDYGLHFGSDDHGWYRFLEKALREKAANWLRDRGWDVEWT